MKIRHLSLGQELCNVMTASQVEERDIKKTLEPHHCPSIFSSVRGSGTITESDNTVLTVPVLDFLEHCLSLGEAS